jgi:hypothetical protein
MLRVLKNVVDDADLPFHNDSFTVTQRDETLNQKRSNRMAYLEITLATDSMVMTGLAMMSVVSL